MSWPNGEVRKIKITLMRPVPKSDNLTVSFAVNGTQKDEFEAMLNDYFNLIQAHDGLIGDVKETLDAETGDRCELSIAIHGLNQTLFAHELQSRASKFTVLQ